MNRSVRFFLLMLAITTINCLTARAQDCASWAKVTGWTGSYTLAGNYSGTIGTGSFSVARSGTANENLGVGSTVCPGPLVWGGPGSNVVVSMDDVVTAPCPPPGSGIGTITFAGDTPTPDANGAMLTIDPTNSTYTFHPFPQLYMTETIDGCGVHTVIGPVPYPIEPFSNWPLTFPLPSTVKTLTLNNFSFEAIANDGNLLTGPWVLSFTLTPSFTKPNDNVDHPCPETGGSTIGCQNQSLGEDVPIIGTGFFLHYESDRAPGTRGANSVATADALSMAGWTLNIHHAFDSSTNTLYLGDGSQRSAWQLGAPIPNNGNILLTSEDGGEVYVFDVTTGRHVKTLRSLTGALEYQFTYDAAGNLISVTDANGNVTTINRDGAEHPASVVSPFSHTTTLSVDANGFLNQVTDPAGNTEKFSYNATGLMTARTDANGNTYNYTYDANGKLTNDADPVGGFTSLSRTDSASGYSVTKSTAMGRTTAYQVATGVLGEQLVNTWPNGLQASVSNLQQNGQLSENTSLPDGTTMSQTLTADPRWGLQAATPTSGTVALGNLTMATTGSRVTNLSTPGDPFSMISQTDTSAFNGRTYTSAFTTSNRTQVNTSPVGRVLTTVLDSQERPVSTKFGTLTATTYTYDSQGRLTRLTQGARKTNLSYDANGFMASVTDPVGLKTRFTHDLAGRLLATTLVDGRIINYAYDANGNLTSLTPPGTSAHNFLYTPVDLPSVYTPPTVAGTGSTTYAYNADRDLTTVTRPDGLTIKYAYDSAGRLSTVTTPTRTIAYTYDAATGNLANTAVGGGEAILYTYNGPLLTSATWSGPVAGSVSFGNDNNFWLTLEAINGGHVVNFTYDNDGLLTKAGQLAVTHNAKTGLIAGTVLAKAHDARTYNGFAEPLSYTAKFTTTTLYAVKYARDNIGRITAKKDTIGGATNSYTYTYDNAGRVTGITTNGVSTAAYSYDTNSNRLTATTSSGTVSGTYDAQDRLLTYGNASYTYTANGELASKTVGGQTTTYQYDTLGNLITATLPDGTAISYVIDGQNNRVGKNANGVLVTGFLYDGDHVIAQLDGSNQLVSQFVYGTGSTSPDYIVKGGVTYRIFSDHLSSPRLVVNSTTGQIVEQIDYDEFGNVINDTNPGFQPFGFAGGLYDQDTKLVRFGARDYDSSAGRWTAKDPIRFDAGEINLYGYVLNNPVNMLDPDGDQTQAVEVVNQNSAPAQTSRTLSQMNSDVNTAKTVADAVVDKELGKLVGDKALDKAKKNIAPGAQEEQKKLQEETKKSIPVIEQFWNAMGWKRATDACGGGDQSQPKVKQPATPKPGQKLRTYQNQGD